MNLTQLPRPVGSVIIVGDGLDVIVKKADDLWYSIKTGWVRDQRTMFRLARHYGIKLASTTKSNPELRRHSA